MHGINESDAAHLIRTIAVHSKLRGTSDETTHSIHHTHDGEIILFGGIHHIRHILRLATELIFEVLHER